MFFYIYLGNVSKNIVTKTLTIYVPIHIAKNRCEYSVLCAEHNVIYVVVMNYFSLVEE